MCNPIAWMESHDALASWFEAIGTVGALAAAVTTLAMNLRDRRRAQASQIVLVVQHHVNEGVVPVAPGEENRNTWEWKLINLSSGTITQITAQIVWSKRAKITPTLETQSLGPGDEWPGQATYVTPMPALLCMEFRDSNGRGWRRYENGILEHRRKIAPLELWPQT